MSRATALHTILATLAAVAALSVALPSCSEDETTSPSVPGPDAGAVPADAATERAVEAGEDPGPYVPDADGPPNRGPRRDPDAGPCIEPGQPCDSVLPCCGSIFCGNGKCL
jgi:hypothetical protein